MPKETIIAKLRGQLDFTEEAQLWLQNQDVWFAKERGQAFFTEMRGSFSHAFQEVSQEEIDAFLHQFDFPQDQKPRVQILEVYQGSLIMEAAVTMAGGMGTVYATIKAISELPKLADGFEDLKKRIEKRFQKQAEKTAAGVISSPRERPYSAIPPLHLLNADLTIDARPLRSLQPDAAKDHKIHLSVAVSRAGLVLENLGDETMRDVRIGIFCSPSRRNQWSFTDSFSGLVSLLSPRQTISKRIEEFCNGSGAVLDLDSVSPAFVDCWIQDEHGIYLFNFHLE